MKITVGESGTGGGFEKFCAGETDISDASRPIKDDEEAPVCEKDGVKYTEVQIANDGIAVVTNKDLKVDCLTTDQLKKLWNKGSKVKTRSARSTRRSPTSKLSLYGPGTDSGTFDFFTDEINGEEGVTREDYEAVRGRQPARHRRLAATRAASATSASPTTRTTRTSSTWSASTRAAASCVKPSAETIQDGTYKPLSRPLFMYPSAKAIERPEVKAFMDFVVANQADDRRGGQDRAADRRAGHRGAGRARQTAEELGRMAERRDYPAAAAAPPGPPGPTWPGAPRRRSRGESAIKVALFAAAVALGPDDARDRLLAAAARRSPSSATCRSATSCSGRSGRRCSPATSSPSACCRWSSGHALPDRASACWSRSRSGLLCAIYLAEYAPPRVRKIVKPVLEVLAGVPTIVFGYFALTFFTPEVLRDAPRHRASTSSTRCRPGIILGILVLPTIASVAEDAMSAVPGVAARGRVRARRQQAPGLRCASSSRPRCRASSPRSCSAPRARSARR